MDADAAIAVRLILAIGLSWVLTFTVGRRLIKLDWRGAGVVGGVCAGIALGPAVLGAMAPGWHERLNVGAVAEVQALENFRISRAEDESALAESGVSEVAVNEAIAQNDTHEAALAERIERELERFVIQPMAVASSLGLIFLMLGCWMGFAPGIAGLRIGLLSGLIVALVWAVASRKLFGLGLAESVACGGVLAGGTCWSRGRWRWSVGLGSILMALVLLAVGGATRAAWTAGVAILLGSMLSWTSPLGLRAKRRWAFIAHAVLVPGVIAIVVSTCSVELASAMFAFVMLAGVFSGDAHLFAGWLGISWLESGRRQRFPASAWLGVFEQGWAATSLVLVGLVFASGLIDPTTPAGGAVGLAVAAHAVSSEIKRPSTHRFMAVMRKAGNSTIQP